MNRRGWMLPVLLAAGAAAFLGCGVGERENPSSSEEVPRTSLADALDADTTGYRRAAAPRTFSFPRDHGPHPGYRTEWWYFTGHLQAVEENTGAAGNRAGANGSGREVSDHARPVPAPGGEASFGYELTIFRVAMRPPARRTESGRSDPDGDSASAPVRMVDSDWATSQFFVGHFGVSEFRRERHRAFERFSRGGAGLAGARTKPFEVWLEDWFIRSVESLGASAVVARGDTSMPFVRRDSSIFPIRLRASQGGTAVDLTLFPLKEPVLQGEAGLSKKGPGAGNASYYYSIPRLATSGHVVSEGDTVAARGLSWMDREWSTSALGSEQVGWDWFALQLDDGRDLMYYRLRNRDGTASRFSEGVLVGPEGTVRRFGSAEVELTVLDRWTDPDTGAEYPIAWTLAVPDEDLDLRIRARFPDQLMRLGVRYWEGAVSVEGSGDGTPLAGQGYVELTGYGEASAVPVR